jgi:hypothetical protein
MVVGDDIAGVVPDKSGSGLHALAFFTSLDFHGTGLP